MGSLYAGLSERTFVRIVVTGAVGLAGGWRLRTRRPFTGTFL